MNEKRESKISPFSPPRCYNKLMKGRVVHCKREKYDVYIGRPGPWGNPFPLKKEEERDRVIERYRTWLQGELASGNIKEEDLLSLRGKTLGCWCAPRSCHGDVLLEEAERLHKEKSE
jgi:hypothetical protein